MGEPARNARRDAVLSDDGLYRYSLTRVWAAPEEPLRWVCFCGLNPSKADATIDDPTIRREVDFANRLGANAMIKVNQYAFRATDPDDLVAFADRYGVLAAHGPGNIEAIRAASFLARSGLGLGVFAAWGSMPRRLTQSKLVLDTLGRPLMCLGKTKSGLPRHPLYLPKTAPPEEWIPPTATPTTRPRNPVIRVEP